MRAKQLLLFLVFVFFSIFSTALLSSSCSPSAGSPDCEGFTDIGSNFRMNNQQRHAGNPVDITTGNNYEGVLDFKTSDSFLMFKRHYNSLNAGFNIGLGPGWRSTYDVSLDFPESKSINVIQSDGRVIKFAASSQNIDSKSNAFIPTNPADGIITRTGHSHEWKLPDGRKLHFKGPKLTTITFGNERSIFLYYKNSRLSTVTDELRRKIKFHYTDGNGLGNYISGSGYATFPGHIEKIELPDGSFIKYEYGTNRNLRNVTYPAGREITYTYKEGFYPGFLTSKTVDGSTRSTWEYTRSGKVAHHERMHINGKSILHFSYPDQDLPPNRGITKVKDIYNTETTYFWQLDDQSDEPTIYAMKGDVCVGCPKPNLNEREIHTQASHNIEIIPSKMMETLASLEAKVLTKDDFGYPTKMSIYNRQTSKSEILEMTFDTTGVPTSFKLTNDSFSASVEIGITNSVEQNTIRSQGSLNQPDVNGDLAQFIERLLIINNRFRTSSQADIQFTQPIDQELRSRVQQSGDTLVVNPGNPPLCQSDLDCEALEEAALYHYFAQCSYSRTLPCWPRYPSGWRDVDPTRAGENRDTDITSLLNHGQFSATVFINREENRIIIAYRGSIEIRDLMSGFSLASGGENYQGDMAIALALKIAQIYPDAQIETTGHSLGGGLAILAASSLDTNGVVFGSIGIDEQTAEHYDVPWETTNQINHFHIESDIVGDPPSIALGIAISSSDNPEDVLHLNYNSFLPARANTYAMPQPTSSDWDEFEAHRMARIGQTINYHRGRLGCTF